MQVTSEEKPCEIFKEADIEKRHEKSVSAGAVVIQLGVKMGVAVFAPCLLVVVDGCFSPPADAARSSLPKRLLLEEKRVEKERKRVVRLAESARCPGERRKKSTEG